MTPDERERMPAPDLCRTCANWQESRFNQEPIRQWCLKGHPQHPACGWHVARTPAAGERTPT